jgi:hypothetical protein
MTNIVYNWSEASSAVHRFSIDLEGVSRIVQSGMQRRVHRVCLLLVLMLTPWNKHYNGICRSNLDTELDLLLLLAVRQCLFMLSKWVHYSGWPRLWSCCLSILISQAQYWAVRDYLSPVRLLGIICWTLSDSRHSGSTWEQIQRTWEDYTRCAIMPSLSDDRWSFDQLRACRGIRSSWWFHGIQVSYMGMV